MKIATKKKIIIFLLAIILGVIAWGFISPFGIRAAIANNLWSIDFIKDFSERSNGVRELSSPPISHKHSDILLSQQALLNDDLDQAKIFLAKGFNDNDPLSLNHYARILYLQEDYGAAFETWEKAKNATMLIRAAVEARTNDRKDLLVLAYQSLYRVDSEQYTSDLASELIKKGNYSQAILILDRSVEEFSESPQSSVWLRQIGDSYRANRQWLEAETAYQKALDINDQDWITWMNLGMTYYDHDRDLAKAISSFEKIIEIEPDRSNGYYLMGFYLAREGKFSEALPWYGKALDIEPGNYGFQMAYASLLKETGQLSLAIASYNAIISQFPNDGNAYYEIALVYSLDHQVDMAVSSIEKAISIDSDKIAYHLRAGEIYEKAMDLNKAIKAFESVLRLDPNNSTALNGIERLKGSD